MQSFNNVSSMYAALADNFDGWSHSLIEYTEYQVDAFSSNYGTLLYVCFCNCVWMPMKPVLAPSNG